MKKEFASMTELMAYTATLKPGLAHVLILHDDACSPDQCGCKPTYVVEDGTAENIIEGARQQRAWIKGKRS